MSHYNLYKALDIPPGLSTNQIASHLASRLSDQNAETTAQAGELKLGLAVIGDERRRKLYDRQLNNPSAPEITAEAVRQLAATEPATPTNPSNPSRPNSYSTTTTATSPGNEPVEPATSKSRPPWLIPVAATTTAVALAAAAITWMVTRPSDDIVLTSPEESRGSSSQEVDEPISEPMDDEPEPTREPDNPATDVYSETLGGELFKNGWYQLPEASCNGDDRMIFAGGSIGGEHAVICQVGTSGGYYYKGTVNTEFGKSHDVKMDNMRPGYYEMNPDTKGGTYYAIEDSELITYSPNANGPAATEKLDWTCDSRQEECDFEDMDNEDMDDDDFF